MSLVKMLTQSLPDAHRHIFDFHRQVALKQEESLLSDLLIDRDYADTEDNYFELVAPDLSDDEKSLLYSQLDAQIDESSDRIRGLHSFSYI